MGKSLADMMNSPSDHVAKPRAHKLLLLPTITFVFVISFALDFKGDVGGSLIQFLMAGLNVFSFLILAIIYRIVPRRGLGAFAIWGWVTFLVTGTFGALANSTPFGHYIRTIYPFTLFLQGFLVAWWTARTSNGAKTIVSAMIAAAVVSLFFTLWWGFHYTGESVELIRYQILSPLIPLLIVVVCYDLCFTCRRRLSTFILMAITFAIIAISVTRGIILITCFVAAVVLFAAFGNALRSGNFPKPVKWAVLWTSLLGVIGFITAKLFYPGVLDRWLHRSFGEGMDITFWTRVAAVVGQFRALTANPLGWMTGQGFGSSYTWPLSDFPWIVPFLGKTINKSVWFPGEFMWMPFLYYGGFVVGFVAMLVLLIGAISGFRLLGMLLRKKAWLIPQTRPLWIGVLGYFAFLGMGFTSNPFILRSAALFLGLCLGLILAQRSSVVLAPDNKRLQPYIRDLNCGA